MHAKKEIRAFGIRVLLSRHPEVRKLKRDNIPSHHGNKFWTSSWLLMDYFRRRGLRKRTHVMEVGCGWGLAGIYCAKRHGAVVTGVDIDSEVFPFLRLHAEINDVRITTMRKSFQGLTKNHLKNVDVLLGADICFWDSMIGPLKKLVRRALSVGVDMVLIADPGRTTFDRLGEQLCEELKGEILDWKVHRPRRIEGQILRVTNGR
ncbi:MAG: methyltransferase domain-containing protein [Desulfobacteraceae bacterium]